MRQRKIEREGEGERDQKMKMHYKKLFLGLILIHGTVQIVRIAFATPNVYT